MGLSNEERFSKVLWSFSGWRKKLRVFAEGIPKDRRISCYTMERSRSVAKAWVAEVDRLTGLVVRQTDRNSAYWILGENDTSFRGLMADEFELRYGDSSGLPEAEYESVAWWGAHLDYETTAAHLQHGEKHEGLSDLARWWDAFGYVDSILYSLYRYNDRLFHHEIRERFTRLVGEMINRRFEVCFEDEEDRDKAWKKELYLLLKHRAVRTLLDTKTRHLKGDAYLKKEFDLSPLFEQVAKMTGADLTQLLNAESKRLSKFERPEKERPKKLDGLFGIPPPEPSAPPTSVQKKRKKA